MSDGKKLIAALLAAGSVETLRLADEELFEQEELPAFQFVKNHYRNYGELPTLATVETETRQRFPNAPETIAFYLKKVYDRKLFVALRTEFGELRDALQKQDVDGARAIIDRMKADCRLTTPDNDLRNVRDAARQVLRHHTDLQYSPQDAGIPTGWPQLDQMTGGYQRGDLVTWVARMGLGKTYLLLKQAIFAWLSGYSILIVTMEMTIDQIIQRVLGMETNVDPGLLRRGQMDWWQRERMRRYVANMVGFGRFHLYAGSFSKKVSDVEVLMHELEPDCLYIDGAYLMIPDGATRANRLERVPMVFDQLKRMTITCNRPIVNTSQLSRGAGKRGKDGSMENIAFSDVIGMHSSLVFFIKEGAPPFERSRREIEIGKGREGEAGVYTTNYRFMPTDFSEIPRQANEQRNQQQEEGNQSWMQNG